MRAELNPNVTITGTGSCLPERVVDNDALADLVHGYDAERSGPFGVWVDKVTHIHERRFVEPGARSSDLALVAARQAMDAAGIGPRDLGLIVYASFTPSQTIPGDHCLLAEALGATGTPTFNLMAACAGSVYGIAMAYGLVASGVYDHVLVVGAETISRVLNWHDPVTSILFGDGAGAAIVSRVDPAAGKGMFPPYLSFSYSPRNIHQGNSNVPIDVAAFPDRELQPGVPLVEQALVEMESGPNVLRSAVAQMAAATAICLGHDPEDVRTGANGLRETLDHAWIVPHQANGRILDGLTDRLKTRPERTIRTIYRYGNISAASNLVALDHGMRAGNMERELDEDGRVRAVHTRGEHRIRPGELVLLPTIGGGYLIGCAAFVA